MLHYARNDIDQAIYRVFSTACELPVVQSLGLPRRVGSRYVFSVKIYEFVNKV